MTLSFLKDISHGFEKSISNLGNLLLIMTPHYALRKYFFIVGKQTVVSLGVGLV